MTFKILTIPSSSNIFRYTWKQLTQRAGITNEAPKGTGFDDLNTPIFYGHPEQARANKPSIIVVPASPNAWQTLLNRPPQTLDWLPQKQVMPPGHPLPVENTIPVLFWGKGYEDGSKPFAERRKDGSIIFYADIIAATFFMLSRWEETVVRTRDEHGRFPAIASVAYKQEFLDRPVVDEYALILRAWLKALYPQWRPKPRQFAVKLSHDIDLVQPFATFQQGLRTFGGDLLKRKNFGLAKKNLKALFISSITPAKSQHLRNVYKLAELSIRHNLDSAFYFMASKPNTYDPGYNVASPAVRQCINYLQQQGFEIGFHPGYHTFNNPKRLIEEKARLDAVLGDDNYGGRQHYLRFQVPDTWRHWEEAGLSYDSTVGYADYEGFRCGTCHPFAPFDITQNRELNLLEYPLTVMDATLKIYRNLTPAQGKKRILKLAQRCQKVEGVFTLLWHNSSLDGEWEAWFAMYRDTLKHLSKTNKQGYSNAH